MLGLEGLETFPEHGVVVLGQFVVWLQAAGVVDVGFAGGTGVERQEDREAARGEDARDYDVDGAEFDQFLHKIMIRQLIN